MKKKIAIFGSTGSIGKTLINLIKKDKKSHEITLLAANKNYKELIKQAKFFRVKNLIINDLKSYNLIKTKKEYNEFNVYNNFNHLSKIFKKKK